MITLKILRKKANLTQQQLAAKLHIDRSSVAKWEIGNCFPRTGMLPQLAKILGCSVDELLADPKGVENGADKQERI